jgi:hypothetical protein
VPGERQLVRRREDPGTVGRTRRRGRQDEDRLREVELARDRLQLLRGQRLGAKHHGQRVAGERPVGEDVDDLVRERDHA